MKGKNIELLNQEQSKHNSWFYDIKCIDIEPTHMYIPQKYIIARMNDDGLVKWLNKDDILIIDPTKTQVRESGIYIFKKDGNLLVRQFGVLPFGKDEETRKVVYTVNSKFQKQYFVLEELEIIGAVVSKYTELLHGLYYTRAEREAS